MLIILGVELYLLKLKVTLVQAVGSILILSDQNHHNVYQFFKKEKCNVEFAKCLITSYMCKLGVEG